MTSPAGQQQPPSFLSRLVALAFLQISIGLAIGTLATFFAKHNWIAGIFCHLRIQMTLVLIVWLLIAAICKRKNQAIALFVFFVVNAIWIVPYLIPSSSGNPATAVDSSTVKIMSANVLTKNNQYASLAKTVQHHNPDIAIVIEVNARWQQEIEAGLLSEYPHQHIISKESNFGIGIISKIPFSSVEQIIDPDTDLISLDARFVGQSGRPFRLIATHPYPPLSQTCFRQRSKQLIALAGQLDPTEDNVLAGDFNLTPWSPIFSEVLATGNLKDSRVGFGVAQTWYAFPSFLGSLQIDHVLTSPSMTTISHEVSENYGSDHRAVIVEIQQL